MELFHNRQQGPWFGGWYLKHQSRDGQTLALIPAFHTDSNGQRSGSLQVISGEGSWWLDYPDGRFWADRQRFRVRMGGSCFHRRGIRLNIQRDDLSLQGVLRYGPFTTLRSDIMGPFRLFAGIQCSHGVISMGHSLEGSLRLNGKKLDFTDGVGYIETDCGRSFPDAYLWTQCLWQEGGGGSLMLAIATIPLPMMNFTGCICAILHHGREYRLATYRGARIESWSPTGAVIRQGSLCLTVELLEERRQALRAPVEGRMERTIHESLCATVRYCFRQGNEIIFRHTDRLASFEYADRRTL